MKIRVNHLLVVMLCMLSSTFMTSCLVNAVVDSTKFYQCEVHKSDGSVVSGRIGGVKSAKFNAATKTFSVKTTTGSEKITSSDVDYLLLWDKDYPDRKNQLLYLGQKDKKKKTWMYVEAAGDNLIILASGINYSISGKSELVIKYSDYVPLRYYVLRKGDTLPSFIFDNNSPKTRARNVWADVLKDCPSLVQKITDKTINPFSFEDIAKAYCPK